ncbi:probable serine/threonine-protein kinase MARK-A isoform X2 [Hemibagrus wyckioides]|uniref:probable serine/threonine-protein kinase MARK-A isoform X2 n=1 Tax=Hemibagrus wyckioides TaxID=337641 RepID=UPI00266CAC2D|nr:probable serine/threonine-protein kinase MARK-A isoform X2 [Hemibagrus wyckioides]XP_058234674.1 probable serine/threonine-protein kinase MARK-A isoform X2 [Hemibagrus wyckioides]
MATLVMRNCTEAFVPHPEEEEKKEYHSCSKGDDDVLQREEKYLSHGEIYAFPGPLMRANMQKDELMKFIQQKCQECLLHLDDPQQQKSYFFWTIMEHFHKKNGRVMMAEIGALLFKGYSLLRRKLQHVENQENWCLRLARFLCSATPDDRHRKDIINMGDRFASRGWTFAAHICYVVAQVDLGSQPRFKLIGCNSLPEKKSATREAIERTEVYEYLLSLSSGFGQKHFQEYKCIHAYELAEVGLDAMALEYCEVIATTVLRFPKHIQSIVLEWLISLSKKLLQRKKAEEPEWLMKLRQLLKDKAEIRSSPDKPNCTSSDSEEHLEFDPSVHSEFNSRYTVGELLGTGGFGSVFAGVRKADEQPVAIKVMTKDPHDIFIAIPGETLKLPLEVALMKMVSKPPSCENMVELLEWFETSDIYILVLERPVPCMDLYRFCKLNNRRLSESVAREVMRQVVQAAHHCCLRGVLHRDIKPNNILINPDTLLVKLIDFGCGDLLIYEPYREYAGTDGYYPPEWVLQREYFGVPATVWSLGIVLYELVHGELPFMSDEELTDGRLCFHSGVSEECCDLIRLCLEQDPSSRPGFSEIQAHKWFKKESQDSVQDPSC